MTSYAISQNYDVRDVLSAALWSMWACLRWLALLLVAGAALAGVFALVIAFWLPICQVCGAVAIIGAFGWATYPRSKAVK
jgi:hypothetical protein